MKRRFIKLLATSDKARLSLWQDSGAFQISLMHKDPTRIKIRNFPNEKCALEYAEAEIEVNSLTHVRQHL